ncbi:hypothetical protein [Kineosporia sp. R_H_3]|uniref:hypothetical protein n=1 Tax=Kineosporia sp. R_H_3 TaxID=1961848 RepID=UPI000B4A63C5|nr:hypothetical protein [Kineosporia sp. R_H_3]
MIAVVTVLLAAPLGFLVRSRLAANVAYAVAYLWAFVFQGVYLMLDSLGGAADPAFRPGEFPLAYGLVTAGVLAAGFALVAAGHWAADRRRARTGRLVGAAGTAPA